jgi:hypothetical protein
MLSVFWNRERLAAYNYIGKDGILCGFKIAERLADNELPVRSHYNKRRTRIRYYKEQNWGGMGGGIY